MSNQTSRLPSYWPLFFLLTILEAAVALFALIRIPSEGVGFSFMRWLLLLPLLVVFSAGIYGFFLSRQNTNFQVNWLNSNKYPKLYDSLLMGLPLLASGLIIGTFLLRWWDPAQLLPFYERASPLLVFIIVFSLQSTLWLLILRFGIPKLKVEEPKPVLIAFLSLIFIFMIISLTRLGLRPDVGYWSEPGIAIQGWQLGLTLILSTLLFLLSLLPIIKRAFRRPDLLIGLLVWMLAAIVWVSVPNSVLKNSFYFPIDPPANIPLPYSDSAYYDYMAHSLMIGTDYTGGIPTRPLYIIFLTALHLIFGENYNLIILGQTLVLALIPVIFYFLGKMLHSRVAGITIALLAIFREWTSFMVSSDTRVSNSKILLVDSPTLLLILLSCFFAFRWLNYKDKRSAFIAGGVFGILLLIRTQSMLILPFIFIVAILTFRSEKRAWLVPLLVFILGVTLSVAPWLTRNYLASGKFTFDAPFQVQLLASQYAYTGNLDIGAINLEEKSLSQILITFALKDPGFVAGFISNHFLATEVGALLALPLFFPFNGLQAPINLYWIPFDGILGWQNIGLIIGYLLIIAIGLGAAWKRWRWVGLLPLAFNLGYATANGVGRFSGWRYNLPADWIAYFYFGLGFASILITLAISFGAKNINLAQVKNPKTSDVKHISWVQYAYLAGVFSLLGFLPWMAETINPSARYTDQSTASLQTQITELQSEFSADEIQEFSSDSKVVTLTGRLLYPRTFSKNSGLSSATPWPSYAPRDYPRLGFKLLNQNVREVVFPNKGVKIENVHAQDVLILGCERGDYIEARLLIFPEINLNYLSDLGLDPCSP
ncbi:MAG: glycosyltransferase family 39 protein [Anaerolineae bacterium]|nr:glycosyltransferase family 39 protein [Anaerolineae bacterium]MDK1081759.1 glycosyltransferase family 39 protein [Anaerolineae bacterium]